MLFAGRYSDRGSDCVDWHLPGGALRPRLKFDFEFGGRGRAGSNAPSFNVASSNFGPEPGLWQCAGGKAHAWSSVADLCDDSGRM